jgi:hypothetical protein
MPWFLQKRGFKACQPRHFAQGFGGDPRAFAAAAGADQQLQHGLADLVVALASIASGPEPSAA